MKLTRLLTLLTAMFVLVTSAYSATIPQNVQQFIAAKFPKSTFRFDGLIILPDGTKYLPVFPAISMVNASLGIKTSMPATQDFGTKPNVVVFNNNFVLLKLVPAAGGKLSVAAYQSYPIEVKTGLLPQDLIVPHGLILPEELSGILGDLEIPLYPIATIVPASVETGTIVETKTVMSTKTQDSRITATANRPKAKVLDRDIPAVLKNKKYLVTNLDTEYINVIPSYAGEPEFTLKLDSIARDMKATSDEAYVMIAKTNNTSIDLVDMKAEEIIKQIDLEVQPNEILITPDNRIAFVTSLDDHSIFVIDISTMKIVQKIQVQGMPEKLALSDDFKRLLYYDKLSSKLYCIELKDKYISTLIGEFPNASKFLFVGNTVYALLRTANKLQVMPYNPKEFSGEEKSVKSAELKREKVRLTEADAPASLDYSSKEDGALNRPAKKDLPYRDNNTILPLMVDEEIGAKDSSVKIQVSDKPVDMIRYGNRLFVLGAKNNEVDVINLDRNEREGTVKLPLKGFSKRITQVSNSNIALITNVTDNRYVIFDLSQVRPVEVVPVNVPINNIIILKDR